MLLLATTLLLCHAALSLGAYNGTYYQGVDLTLTGDALRMALTKLNHAHKKVSYQTVWSAFDYYDENIDGCDNNTIRGIYSDKCWKVSEQCGSYKKEGDCFNREHVWPKSHWGGMSKGMGAATDLRLLFPADGYVNNRRGNYPLGEVANPVYTSTSNAKLGPCSTPGYNDTCFEVPDMFKGAVARAYFYVSSGYYKMWDCCANQPGTDYAAIKPWLAKQLYKWHVKFPVNQAEIDINEDIYLQYQANRNPFVDFPDLAAQIWGPKQLP